ncbi:MAG: ABC transporter permease [Acidobacteriota bacterium]|nr:ABC transporter permease [Acidobacteriota bacterium]
MQTFLQDLRVTIRALRKSPGFTAVALVILSLGIGVNTAVFSLVNALLFQQPAGHPEQLVGLYSNDPGKPHGYREFTYAEYSAIRARHDLFTGLLAQTFAMVGVGDGAATRQVFAGVVSSNFFSVLDAPPARGRAFTAAEEQPGANIPVVIVGDAYWRAHGSDPALVGQTLRINGRPFTIVGITEPGFAGTMGLVGPAVWLPLGVYDHVVNDAFKDGQQGGLADPRTRALIPAGRLAPGLTMTSVAPRLEALAAGFADQDPGSKGYQLTVAKLPRLGVSDAPQADDPSRTVGVLLLAMAGAVLLIVCLNLANMMLARGATRRRDVAVQLALGARRGRIVRQLLTEGLVLSLGGGVVGLALAYGAMRLLVASLSSRLPLVLDFSPSPDAHVLVATLAFAIGSTLFFGLGPAWRLTRTDVVHDLKGAGERASEQVGRLSGRNAMVVGQMALALALLVSGGLFARGALLAAAADPGYRLDHELLMNVDPSLAGATPEQGRAIDQRLLGRLRGLPGVESASVASQVSFGDFTDDKRVSVPGESTDGGDGHATGNRVSAIDTIVGADYFRTLGLSVLRGREFTSAEEQPSTNGRQVAIIDEPLAKQLFAGRDPIGRQIQIGTNENGRTAEFADVVGVVPGVRHELFDLAPVPHVYLPFGTHYQSNLFVHLRVAAGDPAGEAAMLGVVRRATQEVDPDLPILSLQTLTQHRDADIDLWLVQTGARMFSLFGGLALLLAAVGVYGVKAYVVSRRTREIGIRMALGAESRDVLWMMLKEGLVLTGAGLGIGLLLAAGVAKLVSGLLYQVGAFDPIVFVAAPLVLALAALAASYVPARRATRVVPLEALRVE